MESFKIEHFKRDNPTKKFPVFSSLEPSRAKEIYDRLSDKIDSSLTPDQLAKRINEIGISIESDNAENDDFILKEVFDKIGISPQEKVFINWYHFDDVDEIRFDDLNGFFDDIWYPGSDDIDIFDETFSWILSVYHDGSIKVVRG
jgi:hypothetical protein